MPLNVTGSQEGDDTLLRFDPRALKEDDGGSRPPKRPFFLPIISSSMLALTLVRKANGRVDGFISWRAPRREATTRHPGAASSSPPSVSRFTGSGTPSISQSSASWGFRSGSQAVTARPRVSTVRSRAGAAGIQVGTAFAFCEESGLDARYKELVLKMALAGAANVFTHPVASPTGFPFKVARVEGSLSEEEDYLLRTRVCDLGYLREAYRRDDASIGHRCPSEPAAAWAAKEAPNPTWKGGGAFATPSSRTSATGKAPGKMVFRRSRS